MYMNVFLTFSTSLVAITCLLMQPALAAAPKKPKIYKGIGLEAQANGRTSQSFGVDHAGHRIWSMYIPNLFNYAYNSGTYEFVVRLPLKDDVYAVNLMDRVKRVPEALVEKVGEGITLLGYPTTQWRVYSLGELCGDVFTSTQAAENIGLNYADQTRIGQGVAEAMSKPALTDQKCENFTVKPALGNVMGYALAFSGRVGEGRVTAINANIDLPNSFINPDDMAQAQEFNAEARKEFLLSAVPLADRANVRAMMVGKSAHETMKILLKLRAQQKLQQAE